MCGTRIALWHSARPGTMSGSFSKTSRAAPAMTFALRARTSAASSTTGPRETFIRYAVRFIRFSSRSPIMCRVSAVRSGWSDTKALSQEFVETSGAHVHRGIRRVPGNRVRIVRIVGQDIHVESDCTASDGCTDAAVAHDTKYLALAVPAGADVAAEEKVRSSEFVTACNHVLVCLDNTPCCTQDESPRQIRGGIRKDARRIRHGDSQLGCRGGIDIVETHCVVRYPKQAGIGRQDVTCDRFSEQRQNNVGGFDPVEYLVRRQAHLLVRLAHGERGASRAQDRRGHIGDAACDEDVLLFHSTAG